MDYRLDKSHNQIGRKNRHSFSQYNRSKYRDPDDVLNEYVEDMYNVIVPKFIGDKYLRKGEFRMDLHDFLLDLYSDWDSFIDKFRYIKFDIGTDEFDNTLEDFLQNYLGDIINWDKLFNGLAYNIRQDSELIDQFRSNLYTVFLNYVLEMASKVDMVEFEDEFEKLKMGQIIAKRRFKTLSKIYSINEEFDITTEKRLKTSLNDVNDINDMNGMNNINNEDDVEENQNNKNDNDDNLQSLFSKIKMT